MAVIAIVLVMDRSAELVRADRDVLYVAPGGACGTVSLCFATIQEAVDAAAPGDEIRVATGMYTDVHGHAAPEGYSGSAVISQVVYIDKTLWLRGGFTTINWLTPDPAANPTLINAHGFLTETYVGRGFFVAPPAPGVKISPIIEGFEVADSDPADMGGGPQGWGRWDSGGGGYVMSASVTISNCFLYSNYAEFGGGLYVRGGDVTLVGNTIATNEGGAGVGLYMEGGRVTLTGNVITGNLAWDGAGGLVLEGVEAILTRNTIAHNVNENQETDLALGGGMMLSGCTATVTANSIFSNVAELGGGGLYVYDSTALIEGNTIDDNSSNADGGGIGVQGGDVTLKGNKITDNFGQVGGGLAVYSQAPITVEGNLIAGNSAHVGGGVQIDEAHPFLTGNRIVSNVAQSFAGGLHVGEDSDAHLVNNIVADNEAGVNGSGILVEGSRCTLLHNTVARNRGGDGSGIWVLSTSRDAGTVVMANSMIVSHTIGITVSAGSTATLRGTMWGIDAWANELARGGDGTIDWDLLGLTNTWGDPVFVDPDGGDYHIGPTSAARDAGVVTDVRSDIDGEPRPRDSADMGADEYWPPEGLKYVLAPLVWR